MKAKRIIRTLIIIAVLCCNIGCDQVSKKIVRQTVEYNQQISLVNSFLVLTKVENTGAFLSVGHALPRTARIVLLNLLPLLVLGFALIYLLTKKNLSNRLIVGLCFIIGGGVGNIYDRILYGSVTDFLHMDFILFRTGIFNMADVSILIGTFLVLWDVTVNSESGTFFGRSLKE
ncbi:MAG: signal peptidase II [Cyclobacteriaceae bacterium]|jgi:signal peptidase II